MKPERALYQRALLLLLIAVACNFLVYYGGKALGVSRSPLCLDSELDARIPLLPWTVLIYVGAYIFWLVNYYLAFCGAATAAQRFLLAHLLGETICFLFFVFLPTTMTRPVLTGDGLMTRALGLVYSLDTPFNLLPSIHCYASYLCWRGVHSRVNIPKWYRVFSLLFACAVCISTLTVKQHIIIDVFAGVALGELSYLAAGAVCRKKTADHTR